MPHRHASNFYYAISRPYPFKWFTPVVVIGGLILAGLFSALNYFANGFQLENVSTLDPQEIQSQLFRELPTFLTNKIKPQCQAQEIPIDGSVFTNQTALTYKVVGVKQCNDGVTWNASSALRYYNDVFQGCSVESLTITMESRGSTPQQRAWTQWSPLARAFISCNISNHPDEIFRTYNNLSQAKVNLTTEYTYIPFDVAVPPNSGPSNRGLFTMTYQDSQNRASMWWGASLLSMFWVQLSNQMTVVMQNTREKAPLNKGVVYFTRNSAVTDITQLDFFDIDYRFYQDNADGSWQTFFANDTSKNDFSPRNIATFDSHQTYPNVWVPADGFAKAFYSTILTDLGQDQSPANILASPKSLTYFTQNMSQIIANVSRSNGFVMPGPAVQSFADISSRTGPLRVTKTNIMAQFLCQEPKQRPGFDIFVSILVQDLVMLNAVWRLYTLIVQAFFLTDRRAGPEHNYCSGCVASYTAIANVVSSVDMDGSRPDASGLQRRYNPEKGIGDISYQRISFDDYRTEPRNPPPTRHADLPLLPVPGAFGRLPKHI